MGLFSSNKGGNTSLNTAAEDGGKKLHFPPHLRLEGKHDLTPKPILTKNVSMHTHFLKMHKYTWTGVK